MEWGGMEINSVIWDFELETPTFFYEYLKKITFYVQLYNLRWQKIKLFTVLGLLCSMILMTKE